MRCSYQYINRFHGKMAFLHAGEELETEPMRGLDSSRGHGGLVFDGIWICVSSAQEASTAALLSNLSVCVKQAPLRHLAATTRIPLVKSPPGRSWPVVVPKNQIPEKERQDSHRLVCSLCSRLSTVRFFHLILSPKQNFIHVSAAHVAHCINPEGPSGHSFRWNTGPSRHRDMLTPV